MSGDYLGNDGIEEAYLGSAYTSPTYRKKGGWDALLAARLDYGIRLGLCRASAICRTDNEIIKMALERNGFETKRIVTGQMPDGSIAEGYHMERPLSLTEPASVPVRPLGINRQASVRSRTMENSQ